MASVKSIVMDNENVQMAQIFSKKTQALADPFNNVAFISGTYEHAMRIKQKTLIYVQNKGILIKPEMQC